MWPSTPSWKPFEDTPCPAGSKCDIPFCIFSHKIISAPNPCLEAKNVSALEERPSKRAKVDAEIGTKASLAQRNEFAAQKPAVFVGAIPSSRGELGQGETPRNHTPPSASINATATVRTELPRSATRPVSPPPRSAKPNLVAKGKTAVDAPVTLYPRKLAKEPVAFTKRWQLLKMLRQYMGDLNEKVASNTSADVKALLMTSNQLNKFANDEEEQIGLENTAVYENVIKKRLFALKKMDLDGWVKERKQAMTIENLEQTREAEAEAKPVETGLSQSEEVSMLRQMISPQDGLHQHGYVTTIPSEKELDETRAALHMASNWEQCDRCHTRFQVFPERREQDGALTTGGMCRHHWGKKAYPKRVKGQADGQTTYSCCGRAVGSEPCSTTATHVFKVDDSKRLSTIMPFIETPPNDKIDPKTAAVCFDCEMGYTTLGMELLRITAISWPAHKPLLDVLVRPLGQILDINTRFSGIRADQFFSAKPYDADHPAADPKDLRIVESPYIARDLFLTHVAPSTPVLGHALENDLNQIRLVHPSIVDTVLLYPHPRGLPIRNGLRALAGRYLGLKIQQAGAAGHDSYEDARATGELVRFKVAERWRKLKSEGWTFGDDGVYPPVPTEAPPRIPQSTSPEQLAGDKRKIDDIDD